MSSFNFKFQFQAPIQSFSFNFKILFQVSIPSFGFRFQASVSSFQSKLSIQIRFMFKFLFKSKFVGFVKAPVVVFSYFEPRMFLKFYTKNTLRAILLDFCIKC